MGMGGGVPRSVVAMQAKGERETLLPRIETTEKSIKILEEALALSHVSELPAPRSHGHFLESLLIALINTNLTQLKANLKEGTSRVSYLNEVIKQAESPVHRASLIHPAKQ
jgi:hypothetical protein